METDLIEIIVVSLEKDLGAELKNTLRSALTRLPGVLKAEEREGLWTVSCYEGAVSKADIEGVFLSYGVRPSQRKEKAGNFFSRWLRALAESNRRRFGLETPDCCKLSSQQKNRSR